jgi:glycosyltransferase involved in cell wall biosynthesis
VSEGVLRVVLTVPSLAREFGGPVDVARGLGHALRAKGVDVRTVGAGAGEGETLPVFATVRGTPIPRSFRALHSAIDGADLVHVLGYRDPVGTKAASAAFRAKVPYLLEPCGMLRPRIRSVRAKRAFDATVGRPVIDRAAAIIATSELERREFVEDGVRDERIRTRRNGLTLPPGGAERSGRTRERYGVPSGSLLVLALGRIARKKGLLDVISAAFALSNAHVLIAGPDANDGTVSSLRRASSSMRGRVHIDVKGLWGRDKLEAFGDADCFALPSQTENFGNAAAEAAAAGLPVVVSDACGVAEVLDRTAHRVIGVGDVGALTAAIAELTRDDGPRRAAASSAPGLRELLDWSSLAEVQLEIYRELLSGGAMPTT